MAACVTSQSQHYTTSQAMCGADLSPLTYPNKDVLKVNLLKAYLIYLLDKWTARSAHDRQGYMIEDVRGSCLSLYTSQMSKVPIRHISKHKYIDTVHDVTYRCCARNMDT